MAPLDCLQLAISVPLEYNDENTRQIIRHKPVLKQTPYRTNRPVPGGLSTVVHVSSKMLGPLNYAYGAGIFQNTLL